MPATTLALTGDNRIEAGADYVRTWQFLDSPGGTPIDITGQTFRASFRRTLAGDKEFVATSVSNDGTGTVTLTIDEAITAAWALTDSPGYTNMQGVWDLEGEDGSGIVVRYLEGTWTMTGDVTQAGD